MTRRHSFARIGPALLSAAMSTMSWAAAGASPAVDAVPAASGSIVASACGEEVAGAGAAEPLARCHVQRVLGASGRAAMTAAPSGYGPADLRDAYRIAGAGRSTTVLAVVVAYHDATAMADLQVYRQAFGLPACIDAHHCFTQVDQRGGRHYPPPDLGWSEEEALDVEIASAMCPRCRVLVVEADSAAITDLAAAVDEAAALGAHVIVNSFGAVDTGGFGGIDSHWNHPGVAIAASSGGSTTPSFPASSEFVTAVGGTTLARAGNARGWQETAWGAGACSRFAKPPWQQDTLCTGRTMVDVAAVADPSTGVAVYAPVGNGSSWVVFGGTSVSTAIIAGVYAVNGGTVTYGRDPYAHPSALFDITTGGGGGCGSALCQAQAGYDGPTGMGSPDGARAFGGSR
jgi:subtilase family serine protease